MFRSPLRKRDSLHIAKLKNKYSEHKKTRKKTLRYIKKGFVDSGNKKKGEDPMKVGSFNDT